MADFRTHVTVSSLCGIAYGVAAVNPLGHPVETAVLAGTLTAVGGMLPDLDSDSGRPVREMSSLFAAVVPLLAYERLRQVFHSQEGVFAAIVLLYGLIRYVVTPVFKYFTVHRGMYHSVPAMLIFGLIVYLEYHSPDRSTRLLLALGVMIGFFSHLLLDEIWSVGFDGVRIKLKSSAGSAVKFFSPAVWPNVVCYGVLGGLLFLAYMDFRGPTDRPVDVWEFLPVRKT